MGLSSFTSSTQHSLQELQLRGSLLVPDQIQYFIALKILCIGEFGEMAALPEWLVAFPLFNSCILWIAKTCCICPPRKPCDAPQLKTLMIYGSPNLNIERSKIDHIPFVDIQSTCLKVATLHLFLWLTQEACKKFASNLLDASDAKALQVALGSNAIVSLNFILVILYFQNSGHVLQQRVVQDSPCSPYLEKLLVTFWWFL